MKDELKFIFGNINDWLKYAEAKHAGLIVFNSALIIGVLSTYKGIPNVYLKIPTIIGVGLLGISILCSVLSQFPVTSNLLVRTKEILNPNIYFFGDLASVKFNDFISEFKKSYTSFNPDSSDKNLINQILINSKITASKFKIFKIACIVTILAISILGISTIIKSIWL